MKAKTINNRYKILKKLGAGGMGEVYKAKDTSNDSIVALKILSGDEKKRSAVLRFREEFSWLTKLRHPNLVQVYDFDVLGKEATGKGRQPTLFFTMEYVEGVDLLGATEGIETTSSKRKPTDSNQHVSWAAVYHFIVQICRALEYIHSRGLIHYDIKPSNILVTGAKTIDSAVVKLLDFGLAKEETTDVGAQIRGTPQYIAPEIIKGGRKDYRADLYSLGCVLYEIVSRKPPFESDSLVELLKQHLELPPAPPITLNARIPKGLQRIILRLLEKEPADRFQSANEVIREVNKVTKGKFATETGEARGSYLLSGKFIDRKKELNVSKQSFHGLAKVLFISGEPGIGKSRLLQEFGFWAQMQGAKVFSGRCQEFAKEPYQGFVDIFRELIDYADDSTLGKCAPYLETMLGDSVGSALSKRHLPKPKKLTGLEPQQERLRNIDNLTQFVIEISSSLTGKPIVIFIDDLHWGDGATLDLLEYLSRNISKCPVLICGTHRVLDSRESLSKSIGKIRDFLPQEMKEMSLNPLTKYHVKSFIHSVLGRISNAGILVDRIFKSTAGNPLFVEEILRSFEIDGAIKWVEGKWLADVERLKKVVLPDAVKDTILKKLAALEKSSVQILNAGSVIGREFSTEILRKVVTLPREDVTRTLARLVDSHILAETEMGGKQCYQFPQATLQEVLYERLTGKSRKDLHQRVGEALERLHSGEEKKIIHDLAYHFIRGTDREKGITYGMKSADKSGRVHAHERAVETYETVLELLKPNDRERRVQVLEDLVESRMRAGDLHKAVQGCHSVLKLISSDKKRSAKAYRWLGSMYREMGKFDEAIQYLETALENTDGEMAVKTRVVLANTYVRKGENESASRLLDEAFDSLKSKDSVVAGLIWNERGMMNFRSGHREESHECFEKSFPLFQKHRDRRMIAGTLNALAGGYRYRGEFDKAIEHTQRALRILRRMGDNTEVVKMLQNLGLIYYTMQNYDLATNYCERSLRMEERIGNRYLMAHTLRVLGDIYACMGDYSKAIRFMKRGFEIATSLEDVFIKAGYLVSLAQVYGCVGDYSRAIRYCKESLRLGETMRNKRRIGYANILLGDIYLWAGKTRSASRYLSDALRVYGELKDKGRTCETLSKMARLHRVNGDYVEGFKAIDDALRLAQSRNDNELMATTLAAKGKLLAQSTIPESRIEERAGWLEKAEDIAKTIHDVNQLSGLYCAIGDVHYSENEHHEALVCYRKCARISEDCCKKIEGADLKRIYMEEEERKRILRIIQEIEDEEKEKSLHSSVVTLSHERLVTLYEISKTINSVLELDEILEKTMDLVIETTNAERGLIILVDKATQKLEVESARNMDRETIKDAKEISHSIIRDVTKRGKPVITADALSEPDLKGRKSIILHKIKSIMCVPLRIRDDIIGTIYVDDRKITRRFTEEDSRFLMAFSDQVAVTVENAGLRKELISDVKHLKEEVQGKYRFENIIGSSPEMQNVYGIMEKVIDADVTVLIEGETGTGKELVARAIHYNGSRKEGKFVPISCSALPETLLETELFGHAKGAFSGASSAKPGLFEVAGGGTLFLDDVGDLASGIQPKLLRVLQEKEVRRIGETSPVKVDVRIVTSTNRDLREEVRNGGFREDLFYRLAVVRIKLPPLRERRSDIPQLANHFLTRHSERIGKGMKGIRKEALDLLLSHHWPGNVRELEHVIETAIVMAKSEHLELEDVEEVKTRGEKAAVKWSSLREARENAKKSAEITCICDALARHNGNVTHAAESLNVDRRMLRRLIRKYKIEKSKFFK